MTTTTSWKTNHILLAEKLIKAIGEADTVSFDVLEARARKHGIAMGTFDSAIALIHKLPNVKRSVAHGTVQYAIQVVKPKPGPGTASAWVRENYPWPGVGDVPPFEMPFPEIDMSWILLSPEELDKYKAEAAGRTYIPRKRYGNKRG